MSTAEHARRVLGSLNVDRGLVDLAGVQRSLAQNVADYEASRPRDPNADDLYAWVQQRVTALTGKTEPFEDFVAEHPQTRPLLEFGFAVHTQHQNLEPVTFAQSMPVPTVLARLEPDFFPELAAQLEAERRARPAFDRLLRAGSTEMDRIIAAVAETPDGKGSGVALMAKPSRWKTAGMVMFWMFVIFAQGSYSC